MNDNRIKPGLYGQKHSSRDYTNPAVWGKNQFNSSFPASLVAYMSSKGLEPVYIQADGNGGTFHGSISATRLFGVDPLSDDAYYDFEAGFTPYECYYSGEREKIDLVMVDRSSRLPLRGLEVKLTALPDDTTRRGDPAGYSCEIVVRPPTICFLACSVCRHYDSQRGRDRLRSLLAAVPQINHWDEADEVAERYAAIQRAVLAVCADMRDSQSPLIVQPVWKSDARGGCLADDCLDVFVWSDLAVLHPCFTERAPEKGINRLQRAVVWTYKMLFDFSVYGQFDYTRIIKHQSYNTANDKAFALSGSRTLPFLRSEALSRPRIGKSEIKNIIIGGGQEFLSPERRFDAVIVNTPDLFD